MEGNSVFFKGHVGMYRLFGFTGTSAFHLGTLEHEVFQYMYVNQDALGVGNLYVDSVLFTGTSALEVRPIHTP